MTRANDNNSHRALEQFQKMKPLVFEGEVDPLQAETWLLQIEKILDVMNCTDEQRVSFSSFMFQKKVEYWWRVVKGSVKSTREPITWKLLVHKSTEKYIPETTRDKMASEFLELRQSQMNVSQYDQRFTQLSRYAVALVKSEAERIKRFVKGLKSEIRGRLILLQLRNYLQAVEEPWR